MHLSVDQLDRVELTLVTGIKAFMAECGFKQAHLGLSGGIDSALVAYLASRAIGAENVVCFGMPSRFSSQSSTDDAAEMAANIGLSFQVLPIEDIYTAFISTLEPVFQGRPFDIAEENVQSRIRGTLMMAFANKFGSMLMSTGNKSEISMGYCTLYGDTAGALAPIGALFKTEVFALCERINERAKSSGGREIIPRAIIDKPPSAELRPNQKDEDSLPPYSVLDQILRMHTRDGLSRRDIAEKGWNDDLVGRIVETVAASRFKQRQMPPVIDL